MGLFDRSSSTTNTQLVDQTETNTNQTDQSGNSGLNFSSVAGGVAVALDSSTRLSSVENTSLQTADSHDIFDSRSVSSSTSNRATNSGNTTTTTTLSDAGAVDAGRLLGLAGIDAANRANADSLSVLAGLANNSIDASKTLARDSASTNADFLTQAVSGFGSLAKQSSASSDDRIAKIVGFALLAIAVVVVGPSLLRGGGKAVLA